MFIKVSYNQTMRKFKLSDDSSLDTLQQELFRRYGEDLNACRLNYLDADKELISITCEEDWQLCVEEAQDLAQGNSVFTVPIVLKPIDSEEALEEVPETTEEAPEEVVEATEEDPNPEIQAEPIEESAVIVDENAPVIEEVEQVAPGEDEYVKLPENEYVKLPENEEPQEEKPVEEILENSMCQFINKAKNYMEELKEAIDKPAESMEEPSFEGNTSIMSSLSQQMKDEISELIDEKLSKQMKNISLPKAPEPVTIEPKKVEKKQKFTHKYIICDGCKKTIHDMARFKSLVKADFDLCEKCEATGKYHVGPMVKYTTPSKYSPYILNNKYNEFMSFFKDDVCPRNTECFDYNHEEDQKINEEFNEEFEHWENRGRRNRCGRRARHMNMRRAPGTCTFSTSHPFQAREECHRPAHRIQDTLGGIFGNIVSHLTNEFKKDCERKAEKKVEKEAEKRAEKAAEKAAEKRAEKLATDEIVESVKLVHNIDAKMIEDIMRANGLATAEEVVTFLSC